MLHPTPTITSHHGAGGGQWRTVVALCLSLTLGFAGTSAVSAATGPPAPDDASATSAVAATAARVVEFPMSLGWTNNYWRYGTRPSNDEPITLVIGPDTRTLVLDVVIEPLGPVFCEFGDPEADDFLPFVTAQWTAEQWSSSSPKTLAIPGNLTGDHYLFCDSGAADRQNWLIEWSIYGQRESAPAVLVLTNLEKDIKHSNTIRQYNSPGLPKPVLPGDIVRVSGAPGTWPQDDDIRISLIKDFVVAQGPSVSIDRAVISADGSTVEFRMPSEPSPGFFGPKAIFQVVARSTTDGPPRHTETTVFRAPLVFAIEPLPPIPVPAVPTVDVTLSARYALSFQRRTATAVVKTTGIPTPTGTVAFAVNGKPVGEVTLGANGKAAFRLPALDRGRYSVTATFIPRSGTPSTVSPGAWLRVLL